MSGGQRLCLHGEMLSLEFLTLQGRSKVAQSDCLIGVYQMVDSCLREDSQRGISTCALTHNHPSLVTATAATTQQRPAANVFVGARQCIVL